MGVEACHYYLLTSAPNDGGRSTPRPAPPDLPQGMTRYPCTGMWVNSRADLDGCGNISSLPEFDQLTVYPVASFYTVWAIPALAMLFFCIKYQRTRFEILTSHSVQNKAFGVLTMCNTEQGYKRFKETCCFHFQGQGEGTIRLHFNVHLKNYKVSRKKRATFAKLKKFL